MADLMCFAINNGYCESILRGLRSSFLQENHYSQMKNCGSLAELKSFLEETDYAPFLMAEPNNIPVSLLRSKLKRKLADEFEYIKAQSSGDLYDFINLFSCQYMIDNIVNMIEGIKNKVDPDLLLANLDPLGYFPEIKNIKVMEGDDYSGLYRDVLIDTPVGVYFMRFLEESFEGMGENRTMNDIQALFREMKPEFIRTSLKRMWLEDMMAFVNDRFGGETKEILQDLVQFEADFKTLQVVYNSLSNRDQSNTSRLVVLRKQLCPLLGYLYPDQQRALQQATTLDQMKEGVKGAQNYKDLLRDCPDPHKKVPFLQQEEFSMGARSLDDIMYDEETRKYAQAFEGQGQYAVFYSYLKLKEQEIRNIIWLGEMIARKLPKNHPGWKKIIVPFSHFK